MHMPLAQGQLEPGSQSWCAASRPSSGSVSPQAQSPAHSEPRTSQELPQDQLHVGDGFDSSSAQPDALSANSPSWTIGGGGGGGNYTGHSDSNRRHRHRHHGNISDAWVPSERREDPSTGGYFTRAEFVQYYGNDHVWSQATSSPV